MTLEEIKAILKEIRDFLSSDEQKFSVDDVKELIQLLEEHGLEEIEVETLFNKVRVVKSRPVPQVTPAVVQAQAPKPPKEEKKVEEKKVEEGEKLHEIKSPIVGTFYRRPYPGAEPYVKEGDHVTKGQVLCIVEAMKIMNEIESDVDGTIVKIIPEDASPVGYGDTLFLIKPD